jgi:CBS domain-containing protein
VKAAAQRMREYHVGSIVVVNQPNGKHVPAGFVTDRDIAVAVVALGRF